MNIEELRDFCLGLGEVDEKIPFGRFSPRFSSVLVLYIGGHMFCLVDMDSFDTVTIASEPEEKEALMGRYACVGEPQNPALKNWVSIRLGEELKDAGIFRLVARAYEIVKARKPGKTKNLPTREKK